MLTGDDYVSITSALLTIATIILIIRALYRHWMLKKVAAISKNYKTLQKLNSTYVFPQLIRPKRAITHPTKSYRSLQKLKWYEIVIYHLENNIANLREDMHTAISNKTAYDKYMADLRNRRAKPHLEKIESQHLSEKQFLKYEKILIEKNLLPIPYNIELKLKAYYRSPKGQKYYERKSVYRFKELAAAYHKWQQQKSYVISVKYERSIMSDSIRYNVLKRDDFRCCICGIFAGEGAKLHVDHIIPVSKGGKTVMSNLQTLCERCNLGKSNKL